LCPDKDVAGLENLQQLFHCTFASIRDTTISYVKEILAEEEESRSSSYDSDTNESNVEDEANIAEQSVILEETDNTDNRLV
jgi:hypothetical protein